MDFKDIITITKANRKLFADFVSELSDEQLNEIPAGCTNNIAWNFGHIVVSQQALCYLRAGIPVKIQEAFVPRYIRGSKPEDFIDRAEINELIKLSETLIDEFEKDYESGVFNKFEPYVTFYGVPLENIEKAFSYSATHDMQHWGMAMIQKKLV